MLEKPVFISSDAVLQAIHNSYDNILKDIEKAILSPALISALASMHSALAVLDQRYGSDARMTKTLGLIR